MYGSWTSLPNTFYKCTATFWMHCTIYVCVCVCVHARACVCYYRRMFTLTHNIFCDDMVLSLIYSFFKYYCDFPQVLIACFWCIGQLFSYLLSWYCKQIGIAWCAHTLNVRSPSESNWPDDGSGGTKTCYILYCTELYVSDVFRRNILLIVRVP
jgi:hypothetical protein